MFGLYGTGETWLGAKGIERRVLCFASDTNGGDDGEKTSGNIQGDIMEVKVYRSKGRKRIQPEVQSFDYSPRTQNIVSKRRNESGEEGIWYVPLVFLLFFGHDRFSLWNQPCQRRSSPQKASATLL